MIRAFEENCFLTELIAADQVDEEGDFEYGNGHKSNNYLSELYLREVGAYSPLTKADEVELGKAILGSDKGSKEYKTSREKLIIKNLRLVIYLARKYSNDLLSFEDRIQAGNIGLMSAVDNFDPNLGCRFSTYATIWIRQAIDRAIMKNKQVHVPIGVQQQAKKYFRLCKVLEEMDKNSSDTEESDGGNDGDTGTGGSSGSMGQLLDRPNETNVDVSKLRSSLKEKGSSPRISAALRSSIKPAHASADDYDGYEDDVKLEEELISTAYDPFKLVNDIRVKGFLEDIMSDLERDENIIVFMKFGLDEKEPRSLDQISSTLNFSREQVRRKLENAIRKIRRTILMKGLSGADVLG